MRRGGGKEEESEEEGEKKTFGAVGDFRNRLGAIRGSRSRPNGGPGRSGVCAWVVGQRPHRRIVGSLWKSLGTPLEASSGSPGAS